MAERPMEPQAFNTLTSFYKNKGIKPKYPSKSVFVSWLYYGTSEMKDGTAIFDTILDSAYTSKP